MAATPTIDGAMRTVYAELCRQPGATMADLADAGLDTEARIIGTASLVASGLVRVDKTIDSYSRTGWRYYPTGEATNPTPRSKPCQ